jgi:phage tail sheath protein FI
MANAIPNVPGVYLRDMPERRAPVLPTGVPAFIGLVAAPAFGPVSLHRKSEFPGGASFHLKDAVDGFFDNGGSYCYVVGVSPPAGDAARLSGLIDALQLLASLSDIDLVAIPDAVALPATLALEVQRAIVRHSTENNCVALLDSLPDQALIGDQIEQFASAGPVNAALYHPWIRTIATGTRFVPPSGHVAGIISRTDASSGVFKAPANIEIRGAIDLQVDLDSEALALLNAAGVNCIRAFPARGIRIWGACTPSTDLAWRYLNVRRLVLTVMRWIDLNMRWASFEPHVPALWARIQRELSIYLTRLWRDGALQGDVVEQAFYIRCDADLNPPETRESGQVVTEVGLAPTVPAEFIVVSVRHRAGTTELI